MNLNERNLFKLCKIGDLNRVKQLIENEEVKLNIRDKWDSTPLYYACLCGHLDLVEYLLANGARCETNTFDGERCQYGALTDQIRNVLRNFKVVTNKLDQYELFLERLLELGLFVDITFEIKGRLFKAHKCILAARSEYFKNKFENKWQNRSYIVGSHEELIPEAFESILTYIYTDRFSTLKAFFKPCLRLAKLFKLSNLIDKFNKRLYLLTKSLEETQDTEKSSGSNNTNSNQIKLSHFNIDNEAGENKENKNQLTINDTDIFLIGKFGLNSKLSNTITIEANDNEIDTSTGNKKQTATGSSSGLNKINSDLKKLVDCCVPSGLKSCSSNSSLELIVKNTHDLRFILEDNYTFYAHKAFIAERCDYFKTFLHDPFNEIQSNHENKTDQVSHLNLKDISKEIFTEVLYFIYSNDFSRDDLDENILYEVLQIADLYLLPSLKRKCASELITNHLKQENVFDLLKLSRLYDLKKLEFACISFLASKLLEFENSEELRGLIIEDASKLKLRQETDTIDIIDDLRSAINESLCLNEPQQANATIYMQKQASSTSNFDRLVEKEMKLNLIDKILKELSLEC